MIERSIPAGTMKASFLIETLPRRLQMEEILWNPRARGGPQRRRWDAIFSDIRSFGIS
jgi:malate synthase